MGNACTSSLLPTTQRGKNWIAEGEKEKQVGFVLSGNLRHYYTYDGEEKTTYFYFEDHLVSGYFIALSGNLHKLINLTPFCQSTKIQNSKTLQQIYFRRDGVTLLWFIHLVEKGDEIPLTVASSESSDSLKTIINISWS